MFQRLGRLSPSSFSTGISPEYRISSSHRPSPEKSALEEIVLSPERSLSHLRAPDASQRRWHVSLTAFTALVSLMAIGIVGYTLLGDAPLTWQTLGYLAFVASLPVFVWLYMHTVEEYLVGVLLFVQAAVIMAGSHYEISWQNAYFPLFALFAILAGVKQHLDYRKLNRELQTLRQQA